MVNSTPHLVVGPFSEEAAGVALKAACAVFGPVEAEITRNDPGRAWLLLRWPKTAPDKETQLKVLGFCHGAAWNEPQS